MIESNAKFDKTKYHVVILIRKLLMTLMKTNLWNTREETYYNPWEP